jgi:hypothetical protein
MRRATPTFLFFCSVVSCLAAGAARAQLPRPSEVVKPRGYVSLEPVPRGRAFEIAVVAKIRPGFHINSHEVTDNYLIATTLDAGLPSGFHKLDTFHPPGVLRSFKFSPTKLFVYEDIATLLMKIQALADAPLGPQKLILTLRYQPCSEDACLPPVNLPVPVELEVAAANAAAQPAHRLSSRPCGGRSRNCPANRACSIVARVLHIGV